MTVEGTILYSNYWPQKHVLKYIKNILVFRYLRKYSPILLFRKIIFNVSFDEDE